MIKRLLLLSKLNKQIVMALFDSIIVITTLFLSFSVRLGLWYYPEGNLFWAFILSPVVAIPIFFKLGLYRTVIRYFGFNALWEIFKAVSLYTLIWSLAGFMVAIEGIPRSVILINWVLLLLFIGGIRLLAFWYFSNVSKRSNLNSKKVIIYGAGSAGRQLSVALNHSNEYQSVAFIDDNNSLHNRKIGGIKIYSPDDINIVLEGFDVSEVLLAIPSAPRRRQNEIISSLEPYPVMVRILPGVSSLVSGEVKVQNLRKVNIEDLLGRDKVSPDRSLLHANIENKVVMVTGAGGSIGSELCRMIVNLGAKKLILFEQSEFFLYSINKELSKITNHSIVVPILGSVINKNRLKKTCLHFGVQTIYHAAAYKHVPMVEVNNTEGVMNNIFGTLSTAQVAIECSVETFVLISTDKAVRPTNTMGATKRIAELVLQSLSDKQSKTKFTMVRFGNVLGSSGSVIPLFNQQIKEGGPITVTDKDIIRYFMTISEAVELVIQAGAMGKGGDVFVLDMGDPVRIEDLAKKMIRLSGLEVKNDSHPDGDIEIEYTGLRSGEKLYEELLIGDNVSKTDNPLIMRAEEDMLTWDELKSILDKLNQAVKDCDPEKIRVLLIKAVPSFLPQCEIIDFLYRK